MDSLGPLAHYGCKGEGSEVVYGEAIVAGCNAPPVLKPAKESFDQVAAAVGFPVERIGCGACRGGRDHRVNAARFEPTAQTFGVVTLSAINRLGEPAASNNGTAIVMSATLPGVRANATGRPQ